MSHLVKPHGSDRLKPLLLEGEAKSAEKLRAEKLPQLRMSSRETGDLIMMGIGGFTPLDGFMSEADWRGVCDDMHLANGLFWPIPITLSTDSSTADSITEGAEVALTRRPGQNHHRNHAGHAKVRDRQRRMNARLCTRQLTQTTPA